MVLGSAPAPLVAGVSFSSLPGAVDGAIKKKECKKLASKGMLSKEQIMKRYNKQILAHSGEHQQLREKFEELWLIEKTVQRPSQPSFFGCFILGEYSPRPDRTISSTDFLKTLSAPFGPYSKYVQQGLLILYRVFTHFSHYPFPASPGLYISEDACYRGILFLAGLYEWAALPGSSGPCQCGPYQGNALTHRATTSYDERRRMFRFLATPIPFYLRGLEETPSTATQPIMIPVPQFTYITPKSQEGSDGSFSVADRVIIQDNEDEREVDLLDVLLETYPSTQEAGANDTDGSSVTDGPYRDSLRFVIPTLPRHEKSLNELNIDWASWRAFLRLLLVSKFGVHPDILSPMFEQSQALEYVLDAMCFAFVEDEDDELNWSAFNVVIPRSMPVLFRNVPNDGLPNLLQPFLQPRRQIAGVPVYIPPIPSMLLSQPHLAQLRTFTDHFTVCTPFFGSHIRIVDHNTTEGFRSWRDHRYMFISGYEKKTHSPCSQIPPPSEKVLVGIAIHDLVMGSWGSTPRGEHDGECEIQAFQLSPVHRVYGFEKARIEIDPMMSVKFGIPDDNWEKATKPTGRTRIAFMEDMNECVFEHGSPNDPDEWQRWVPFGRGNPGVRRITVEAWEVWGFT